MVKSACICVQVRQPWAEVEVKPAQPTAEQREWLEKEGFIKDEEEGAEGDQEQEPGDKRRVHDREAFVMSGNC